MATALLAASIAAPATAAVTSRASGTEAATSARWGAAPASTGGTPTLAPLTLSYNVISLLLVSIISPKYQVFDVVNTGATPLTGASYTVTVGGSGLMLSSTMALDACVGGAWSGSTCSAQTVHIGQWNADSSGDVLTGPAPTAPGARLGIKATPGGSGLLGGSIDVTVSVAVSSGPGTARQIRAATISNL